MQCSAAQQSIDSVLEGNSKKEYIEGDIVLLYCVITQKGQQKYKGLINRSESNTAYDLGKVIYTTLCNDSTVTLTRAIRPNSSLCGHKNNDHNKRKRDET